MNKEDAEKMLNKNSILCEHGDDIIVRIKNGNYLQILVNFSDQLGIQIYDSFEKLDKSFEKLDKDISSGNGWDKWDSLTLSL